MAFEAAKDDRSINEIATECGVHPQQVRAWKREFLEKIHLAFEKDKDTVALQKELEKAYQKIGQLELERVLESLKWECVYLRDKLGFRELREVTGKWVRYYNSKRVHQLLGYKTPDEIYYGVDCKEVAA